MSPPPTRARRPASFRRWGSAWQASSAPPRPPFAEIVRATLGAGAALVAVAGLTAWSGVEFLMAPLGATVVLAFALPESPLAQPRAIVGGHVLSAAAGFAALASFGDGVFSLVLAGAGAIAVMSATRTLHAPAGATPLVVITNDADPSFIVAPVLVGSLLIVGVAVVFNNLVARRRYPIYWR